MKKEIIKYLIAGLVMLVVFASCKKETETTYYDSAKIDISLNQFTLLDAEIETSINFMSETKTVSNVVIYNHSNNKELFSGSATDNKINFTLLRSIFATGADTLKTAPVRLDVNATVDGKVKEMYTSIGMDRAVSVKTPFYKDKDKDGKEIEVADHIYEKSNVEKKYIFSINPNSKLTKYNVKASVAVGRDGTYVPQTYSGDTVSLKGADYAKGDNIFLKLVVTNTDNDKLKEEYIDSSMVVQGYDLAALDSTITMDTLYTVLNKGYDLLGDTLADDTEDVAMVTINISGHDLGIVTSATTSLAAYDSDFGMNLPKMKAEADANPIADPTDVVAGAKYIIKHTRDTKVYYGLIEVAEIDRESPNPFIKLNYLLEEYDVEN